MEPDGYEHRQDLASQFTISLPSGWTIYEQNRAVGGSEGFGVVIFTSEPFGSADDSPTPDVATLARIDSGETPGFFLDRKPAAKGMTCNGFTRKATYDLGTLLAKSNRGKPGLLSALEPKHDTMTIGGCAGLRYRFTSKDWNTEVRAVSDGNILYLFSVRNHPEYFARNQATYEAAIETVKLNTSK